MEVTIPARDAALVKAVAGALCAGGAEARRVRDALEPVVVAPRAQTGAELMAFLRASPLVGAGLEFERDASTGRTAEFG